ncbi:helix-turn-helix domain-containing protein [Streptomyces sp. NPDC058220]|uniref:helix-turn-helix domain-containing protein n=1 Tax=Streptomyces sp. NPDC058220 TaxID=3346387 RepID=UPI0036E95A33
MKANGAAIKALREARGHSLRHLAYLSEMHPSHLSRIEGGKRDASADVLGRIGAALDVPRDAITREQT